MEACTSAARECESRVQGKKDVVSRSACTSAARESGAQGKEDVLSGSECPTQATSS